MTETFPKRVLIIEDHAGIADSLRLILEDEGYQVEIWDRGAIVLQEPFPDLIFLDLLLGGMDGKMICRQLKASATTQQIPIFLMSANKRIAQIADEVGADGWLLKPFELDAILALLLG